jgi:DNA-binding SARP family transcriptional activator
LSRFEIKLFGSIEIYRDGQPITRFRSQKALALLAFLIMEDRPVTREYLAGLIWPEATQAQALGLLRRSLYSLSKQLPDCLETSQRTISFRPDAPVNIDTRQFAQFARQHDPTAWTAAINLYRAAFLEGVYLTDCPTFEQWLITEQKRWQDQVDALLARLIQILIDQGDYRTALTYANRRLALAPWQEETHQQMMRLLLYNGQRNAALAQYDQCVAILDDEFGVDPSPETQALYEQIKQAQPYPPHNLLPPVMPFLGRETELAALTRLIAHPKQRLITLVGLGGMGKTRLAMAVAERQLGRPTELADPDSPNYAYFTHGIFLVSLVAVQMVRGLVPAIADALKFQPAADTSERTPKQQLLDYLRQKRMLLILDNFEQFLHPEQATEATGLLLEILQTASEVQLLITSRERLQLAAEQVYTVQGLTYPEAASDADIPLADYPAIALFNQTAQHIQSDFRCEGEVAVAVARICRMLQGMPLGIELAAATVNVLTPAEILNELTHSLDLLATTIRHIPARHRSIRAAFETSWQQ